jgi:hypothetical protein
MLACALLIACGAGCSARKSPGAATTQPPPIDPLKQAISRIEEDRGEAIGRQAVVEVPAELKHYGDRRRFLAVQAAEENRANFAMPHDYAELAAMIRRRELIELPQVDQDFVLYGPGDAATDQPFTHYDRASGLDLPLCADESDFAREGATLQRALEDQAGALEGLQRQLKTTPRRDRATRRTLGRQIKLAEKTVTSSKSRLDLFERVRRDPVARRNLIDEQATLADFAKDLDGKRYDLSNPEDRRSLKVRMLSFLRPEARQVLVQIAAAYRERFDRPLPITSLIRTVQYQKWLTQWNRSAARNSSPPHVTGLAFDVFYRFMTAGEQEHLMGTIAKLEVDGRVEALRETRDHIHVFVFASGRPPSDELVAKLISESKLAPTKTGLRRSRSKRAAASGRRAASL